MSDWIQIRKARTLLKGCPGPEGPEGPQGPTLYQGNVAIVDTIYGDDETGSMSGSPYKTIQGALEDISYGQTIYVLPGTYTITNTINIPDGISIHGISSQTTIVEMNVTTSATMFHMGEHCLLEGLSLNMNCSGTNDNITLRGILFEGTSAQTSKLRTTYIDIDNTTMTTTTNVIGVEFSGELYTNASSGNVHSNGFSVNSIKNSIIHIHSNGDGMKRGILVSGTNNVSIRDTNIYVYEPIDINSLGSYVGIETNDISNEGTIEIRNSTIGTVLPSVDASYSASDVLQTRPETITDPTYLVSKGIQLGPGTDILSKSAGGKGFSTYVYPTIIYYGLKGETNSNKKGYMWPGTQKFSNDFPDNDGTLNGNLPAYFRVQQPSLIAGLSASTSNVDELGFVVILSIKVTPYGESIVDTSFSVTLTDADLDSTFYDSSFRCDPGDRIHLYLDFSGNTDTQDITAQIDLF